MKRTVVASMVLLAAATACQRSRSGHAQTVTVRVFRFQPGLVHVVSGTTVEWINRDDITHTVTSGIPPTPGVPGVSESVAGRPDSIVDGELRGSGSRFGFTFTNAGRFTYFCRIHNGMTGTVQVG